MHSRRLCWIPALILLASSGSAPVRAETSAGTTALSTSQPPRVYARLYDPREHPDYQRRHTQPPSWETFDHRTRFTCLRGFTVKDGQIVDYEKELDRFTRKHKLGDVIWPSYPIVFAKNLRALAEEIKKRDLFLFDIWGYVPGSGPGGYWQQFTPPPGVFEMLEETLGERWLGMDIGEQDGRYVGSYASQMTPSGAGRFEQHLNFQRHFERMGNDLGNRLATLVSLNFGHYFLKEGVYTLIGAETAQALPNSQVYYAFIRGAGKQYGVPWFGNASIFNRWGWKVYGVEEKPGHGPGPTKGTSLNLLKRLLYSHIFYNCVAAGFENGWLLEDKLTPIGRIQQSAKKWLEEHGSPGVMLTPVALLLDFRSGWSFPRHLYTGHVYRVWGNLPYEPGDYLTDGVLGMLYPRYQDSSYFHDESLLKNYISKAKTAGRISFDYKNKKDILKKLHLIVNDKLLNASKVLFSKDKKLEVQTAVFAGEDKNNFIDINKFNGNIFLLLEKSENYIKEHINWSVEFGELERKEVPEIPITAIREALVNSFCHRDYSRPEGNKIAIFKNRLEIYNPGSFPEGYEPYDFIKESHESVLRNPLIANALYLSKDIEKWGSGLKRIYNECEKRDVKLEFKELKEGFKIIFYRKKEESDTNRTQIGHKSNAKQRRDWILSQIKQKGRVRSNDIIEKFGVVKDTAARDLKKLIDQDRIVKKGGGSNVWYEAKND